MDEKVANLIKSIELKVKQVTSLNRQLKEEIASVKKENAELVDKLSNHSLKLEELKTQNRVLKLAKTLHSEEDKEATKQTISILVREIDKCIALLTN